MKGLIVAVALAMLAGYPAKADVYNDTGMNNDNTPVDVQPTDVQSGTTTNEQDTTLTPQPGTLEENTTPHSAQQGTVDQPATSQDLNNHSDNTGYYFAPSQNDVQSGTTSEPTNQSTAIAPRGIDGRGAWNLNVGPSITLGLDSDNVLYGIGGGYTFNLTPKWGARLFADANFSGGTDSAQYLDLGAAAKYGLGNLIGTQTSRAYVLGDVAMANARNADTQHSDTGVQVGAGAGLTIVRTQRTDVDLLLHYALMLNNVDGKSPSLLTARLGVNF